MQADVPDQVLDVPQVGERGQQGFGGGRQGPGGLVAGQQGRAHRRKVRVMLQFKGGDGQVIEEPGLAAVVKVEQVDLAVLEQVVPLVQVGVDQPVSVWAGVQPGQRGGDAIQHSGDQRHVARRADPGHQRQHGGPRGRKVVDARAGEAGRGLEALGVVVQAGREPAHLPQVVGPQAGAHKAAWHPAPGHADPRRGHAGRGSHGQQRPGPGGHRLGNDQIRVVMRCLEGGPR